MKKFHSILIIAILQILSFIIVFFLTERPTILFKRNENKILTSAIAIRDNVIPFQKFGTKLFSLPILEKCYDTVFYFTQFSKMDKLTEVIKAIKYSEKNFDKYDLFLLSHKNQFQRILFTDSFKTEKLRLVYNTGCNDAFQYSNWLITGADAYVAHAGNYSFSPIFYFYFLRRWASGYPLNKAVDDSNKKMKAFFSKISFLFHSDIITDFLYRNSQAMIYGDSLITIKS